MAGQLGGAVALGGLDLLARLRSAVNGMETSADGSTNYQLEIERSFLCRVEEGMPGELPLFLAIALEAFWSQGARCHGFDELGVRATAVDSAAADVRPNSSVMRDAFEGRSKLLAKT